MTGLSYAGRSRMIDGRLVQEHHWRWAGQGRFNFLAAHPRRPQAESQLGQHRLRNHQFRAADDMAQAPAVAPGVVRRGQD